MILLTTLIMFLAVLASWNIEKHVKAYLRCFWSWKPGCSGKFMSLDLFLFYIFYEVMLLPMTS